MQIYNDKGRCSGCSACENICPINCISMIADEEGFLYPIIDETRCIQCGRCKEVCKKMDLDVKRKKPVVYAAKNKNETIRINSSSGGVFYELAREILDMGGAVYGAAFDEDFGVYHEEIKHVDDIKKVMGSKYVQSNLKDVFERVQRALNQGGNVLFSGTPCQINGLKSFLGREYEKLICVAVICHGVPSPEVWRRYLALKKGEFFSNEIKNIEFRNKKEGWKNYRICINFSTTDYDERYKDDIFLKGFLQNLYLRSSCYNCRSKGDNIWADIILGDYWGIEKVHPELDDRDGTSVVIINSKKGEKLFNRVITKFDCILSDYDKCVKYNPALISSMKKNERREKFFEELRISGNVLEAIQDNLKLEPTPENKRIYLYPLIRKYLANKNAGWNIGKFFEKYNYQNIVLYAATELLDVVMDDIKSEKLTNRVWVCDSNSEHFGKQYEGYPIISREQLLSLYKAKEIDCVIICNLFYENEIIDDLIKRGIDMDKIIAVASIIYSC